MATMAGKLTFLVGAAAGYVLGTRSGRERYDQIVGQAQRLWKDPRVLPQSL
ncbi:MAG: YtxH domain-containing protein, partial [Proteobacteria bacterium]